MSKQITSPTITDEAAADPEPLNVTITRADKDPVITDGVDAIARDGVAQVAPQLFQPGTVLREDPVTQEQRNASQGELSPLAPGGALDVMAQKGTDYDVFNRPIVGSKAAITGEAQHPLMKQAMANYYANPDVNGQQLAEQIIIAQSTGMPLEVVQAADPSIIQRARERQDVQRALEGAEETRRRMALSPAITAILRGVIPAMHASEEVLDEWQRRRGEDASRNETGIVGNFLLGLKRGGNRFRTNALTAEAVMPLVRLMADEAARKSQDNSIGETLASAAADRTLLAEAPGLASRVLTPLSLKDIEIRKSEAMELLTNAFAQAKKTESIGWGDAATKFLESTRDADWDDWAGIVLSNPLGFYEFVNGTMAEQAGYMAAQVAVASAGGGLPAAAATTALSTLYQEGLSLDSGLVMEMIGYDPSASPENMAKFVNSPDDQMKMMKANALRGTSIATVDAATLGLFRPIGRLNLSRTSKTAIRYVTDVVSGGGGEYLAMSLTGQKIKDFDIMAEAFGGTGLISLAVDTYAAGAGDYKQVKDAKEAKEFLQAQIDLQETLSAVSAEQMVAAADVLAGKLTDDGIDNVYIKAPALIEFDQDGALLENLGIDREVVEAAAAEGNPIEIPTQTFIRHILGNKGAEALFEHTMFDVEGMTSKEADDFIASGMEGKIDDVLKARVENSLQVSIDDEGLKKLSSDIATIRDQVTEQLVATGKYSASRSRLYGQLTAQRYATRAVRLTEANGQPVDAMALLLQDNLQIVGAQQAEARAFTQDLTGTGSVKVTDVEQTFFNEILGNEANRSELLEAVPSLTLEDGSLSVAAEDIDAFLEAMNDFAISDGAITVPPRLRALTSSRDIVSKMQFEQQVQEERDSAARQRVIGSAQQAKIDRDTDPQSRFKGMSDEDIQAVYDEGINKINDFFEIATANALSAEKIEKQILSIRSNNEVLRQAKGGANTFIDIIPLGRVRTTAEIDAAGGNITQTAAFKAWFGDSKVVDADGKPLVVYRGEFEGETDNFNTRLTTPTFSKSKYVAGDYAADGEQGRVIPVYLSIQNPIEIGNLVEDVVTFNKRKPCSKKSRRASFVR